MSPRVSIGIPAYNAARYLEAAINSALGQSFTDIEVFVCDNRSTDETQELCAGVRDPRFRYVRFEDHVGQPGNWNRCVAQSGGEFVVLLHADDILEPGFVGRAVSTMDATPDAALVHCSVRHITGDNQFMFLQQLHATDQRTAGEVFFLRLLREGCLINPAGVMVRRNAYAAVGPFHEGVSWGTDWDMWLRLSLAGSICSMAEPLASYREHSSSGTVAVVASGRNGRDELLVIDHVLGVAAQKGATTDGLRSEAIRCAAHRTWCWAEEAARAGHPAAARRGTWEALRMNPGLATKAHVWGLLAASFLGYDFFRRLQRAKRLLRG